MKTGKVVLGITGAVLALIVSQLAAQLLAGLFAALHLPAALCNIAGGILYAVIAFLLLKLFAEKGMKMRLSELGIPKIKIAPKWLFTAFLLPLLVSGSYFLFPGKLQRGIPLVEAAPYLCAGIFFTGLAAGTVEEMVFRGFIMNLLDKRFGRLPAILLPSLLFGTVHILGMGFGMLSCIQVIVAGTLVGIMFSLIALEGRSVWNSAAVHAVWNFIILGGVLYIGETAGKHSLFSYILETNSFAITGGEFGVEASMISIVGYIAVSLIAYRCIKKENKK